MAAGETAEDRWDAVADAAMRRILEYDLTLREKLLAGWLVELTFRARRAEVRIVRQEVFCRLTGLKRSAVSLAVKGLQAAGLLQIVGSRGGERWYRLLPNGHLLPPATAVDARDIDMALAEIASWNELGPDHELSGQRHLNMPTVDETVEREVLAASMDLAVEEAARSRGSPARVHESITREFTNRELKECAAGGRTLDRVRAPAGFEAIRKNTDSLESGAVGSKDRRFRDEERNWIMDTLAEIDARGELREERCKRAWVGRVRDYPAEVREAAGEVKHRIRTGSKVRSPLGMVYHEARRLCTSVGKVLKMLSC